MKNTLTQMSIDIKVDPLDTSILHLKNGDNIAARKVMEEKDVPQNERKFIDKLIKAIEDCDFKSFTSAVSEFDSESTLDHKKISMLLWIKKEIMDANFFA